MVKLQERKMVRLAKVASKHGIGNNEIRDAGGGDCWGLKKFKVAI